MASPKLTTADGQNTGSGLSGQYDASPHSDSPEIAEDQSSIDDVADDQGPKPQPLQKRRRVTRACDECRRKKIKCDGKQPCTHCTVYSYECTYDQPSNRRRNATPQYIEALESQLKRAKALLHVVFPSIDLNDPGIDAHLQNGMLPHAPVAAPRPAMVPTDPRLSQHHIHPQVEVADDSHLEAMVKATGQLDLDEEGNWDYHGHSSGLSFMRGLRQFGDMFQVPPDSSPSLKHRNMSVDPPSPSSTRSLAASSTALPSGTGLPNKKEALSLCENAIIDAGAMQRIVHLPTFYKQLDRMYDTPAEDYTNAENSFLPLLYAVLALGKLFSQGENEADKSNYDAHVDEGFRYFKASRQLLDITDCRDLTSLQAIVFMIQFLQSSAKLSTCYAYIGVALRSALRMGLHRSFNRNFNPIEAETRKRLFWVIRRMDTYVGAMLGLPRFLEDEDIDQDFPMEVDDEYITETEILPMPEGSISVMSAFNAHTRIVQVLSKICRYVYPIKGTQSGGKNSVTYTVKYSKIRELEQDLAQWLDELPMALKPGGEAPHIIIRVQQLLRMAFGHAQLLLYRPFLHYVSSTYNDNMTDQRAFACASACVSVSRNIIHITSEMRRRGLLAGAYWFSMYTTFFAIVSILYFVLENPNSPTSLELLRDAAEGKEVLAYFAKRSMAADRCSSALNSMFERLPEAVKQGREIQESRKRRQDSSPQSLSSRPQLIESDLAVPRRASTFPDSHPDSNRTAPGPSLPISQTHYASLGLDPSFNSPSPSNADFFEGVPGLTPTSSNASLGQFGALPNRPSFPPTPLSNSFTDPSGLNVPISDISTMMFPSADPLAYPNPPMTTFENKHPQAFDRRLESSSVVGPTSGTDFKSYPAIFAPSSMPAGALRRHESEAQLFGPMPMYLMQAAQTQRGQPIHSGSPSMHHIPGQNMHFDELLNQEEWAQTFMDPGMGLPSSRTPFGGNSQFQPPGAGVGGWR
ncbi:fungal-specific transcription factor domain-containing protein [Boeremia exigua]|uniref:fungal-specific transcription factor domain-containing protein n=1 Tax=Boeremia exigua TaxID=749465 RepID=UPI001E8D77D7|nr:fungal-specific transcription factor domain-containing protein [Boeremia exigua]KAH6633487.1 fungal-specific transcription factor domain-containing protein [Boeremia exigua]